MLKNVFVGMNNRVHENSLLQASSPKALNQQSEDNLARYKRKE